MGPRISKCLDDNDNSNRGAVVIYYAGVITALSIGVAILDGPWMELGLGGAALFILYRLLDKLVSAHLLSLRDFVQTQAEISKTQAMLQAGQVQITAVMERLSTDFAQHLRDDIASDREILETIKRVGETISDAPWTGGK